MIQRSLVVSEVLICPYIPESWKWLWNETKLKARNEREFGKTLIASNVLQPVVSKVLMLENW